MRICLDFTFDSENLRSTTYIDATKAKSDELWGARKQLQHLNAQYYEMMSFYHPEE